MSSVFVSFISSSCSYLCPECLTVGASAAGMVGGTGAGGVFATMSSVSLGPFAARPPAGTRGARFKCERPQLGGKLPERGYTNVAPSKGFAGGLRCAVIGGGPAGGMRLPAGTPISGAQRRCLKGDKSSRARTSIPNRALSGDAIVPQVAQVSPPVWRLIAVKGMYREKRLWAEADILGQLARELAWLRGTSDGFCEHFELRPQSGGREALVTKLGHPLLEVSDGEHD